MIIIIFGLAASGKTYVAQVLEKYFGFYHQDADQWLSEEMKRYIHEKKLFTLEMLEDFTSNIITKIEKIKEDYPNIVISQALYRQKNREEIKKHFLGQDLMFIQVDAGDEVIYQRLINRGDWVFPEYASSMRQFFEPMADVKIIKNNQHGDEDILAQLTSILK